VSRRRRRRLSGRSTEIRIRTARDRRISERRPQFPRARNAEEPERTRPTRRAKRDKRSSIYPARRKKTLGARRDKKDRDTVIAGCWAHDLIEDAAVSYNDVLKNTNKIVAEYVYALTNEKGRNRAERANAKYYYDIRIYKHASFIKLCDRIANTEYSKTHNNGIFKMYIKEFPNFKDQLYDFRWDEMWSYLEELIK